MVAGLPAASAHHAFRLHAELVDPRDAFPRRLALQRRQRPKQPASGEVCFHGLDRIAFTKPLAGPPQNDHKLQFATMLPKVRISLMTIKSMAALGHWSDLSQARLPTSRAGTRTIPRKAPVGRRVSRAGRSRRHRSDARAPCQRPVKVGKSAKVAIATVMRKLVVLAGALLREGRPWAENAPRTVARRTPLPPCAR